MKSDNMENPINTTSTQSSILDWMRKEVRFQLARGWLVASGVVALALLLVAID
jgi:hypothetical protein